MAICGGKMVGARRQYQGHRGDYDDPDHGGRGPDQGIPSFLQLE